MGHYQRQGVKVIGPTRSQFKYYWGQSSQYIVNDCTHIETKLTKYSNEKWTKAREESFLKRWEKHPAKEDDFYQGLDCPSSNSVCAYDLGIVGYKIIQRKHKIVNHKTIWITEAKEYKSKPAHIPEGAELLEMHKYVLSYDHREFDPRERGESEASAMSAVRDFDWWKCSREYNCRHSFSSWSWGVLDGSSKNGED